MDAIEGGAFNIQQTLEGLELHGSSYFSYDGNGEVIGGYWSAQEAVVVPLSVLLLFSFLLFGLFSVAIHTLAGRRGLWVAFATLALPGLLSIAGLWPNLQWLPQAYHVGSGSLGSPWDMFVLLAIALSTGWTLVVLATKVFDLGDQFRHGYDQFWYAMAISAGLFFVADMDATESRDQLSESVSNSQAASAYLLQQVRRLESDCETGQIKLPLACHWALRTQNSLSQFAHYGAKLYWQLGPEDMNTLYSDDRSTEGFVAAQALRQQLHQYNLIRCPVVSLAPGIRQPSPASRHCQTPPPTFCTAFPNTPLKGVSPRYGPYGTVAIANECVVPTLVSLKIKQARLASDAAANARMRHIRWVFFLWIALVAGGKVANASIRMSQAIRQQVENNKAAPTNATSSALPSRRARALRRLAKARQRHPTGPRPPRLGDLGRKGRKARCDEASTP